MYKPHQIYDPKIVTQKDPLLNRPSKYPGVGGGGLVLGICP